MTPKQIVQDRQERLGYRCKHGHNGYTHRNCYNVSKNIQERVAILDIEAEDLSADYGIVFCWCVWDMQEKKMYSDTLTLSDIKKYTSNKRDVPPKEDKRVISSLLNIALFGTFAILDTFSTISINI